MKLAILFASLGIAVGTSAGDALADPWKDESGHGRWRAYRYYEAPTYRRHVYKEEFRRGGCKIERKWEGDEYKEEIKCKRRPIYGYYRY